MYHGFSLAKEGSFEEDTLGFADASCSWVHDPILEGVRQASTLCWSIPRLKSCCWGCCGSRQATSPPFLCVRRGEMYVRREVWCREGSYTPTEKQSIALSKLCHKKTQIKCILPKSVAFFMKLAGVFEGSSTNSGTCILLSGVQVFHNRIMNRIWTYANKSYPNTRF